MLFRSRVIERRPSVHESYLEKLLKLGEITRDEAMQIAEEHRAKLDAELSVAKSDDYVHRSDVGGVWAFYVGGREREAADVETGVRREQLEHLLDRLVALPDGFHRIRHFGFMANGHRAARLALCRSLLADQQEQSDPAASAKTQQIGRAHV